ncbi:unnamed protein product [Lymnaea stagnalis]|uniref:PNPLA domain-containing protein n=1 Tax=Lymnaea stagnalis TaxID=6523 RepID=A0AAV2H4H2_LYMST
MGNTQSSNEEETTLTVCCSRGRNKKRKGQGLMEKSDTNQGRGNDFEEVQPLVNCAENEGNVPDFPFENLVFEGGGNKCLAFVGCLKHLEKIGATRHIRRVGGTSGGATIAALVALGYTADEIETFLTEDVQGVFIDHSCGYLSLIPNLFRNYGWNPGTKIYEWLGDKIEKPTKTGKENHPDMTFLELYKKENGMELCVVVTNLNQMRIDYCHPKTTPNMKIRDALRMSMAIPGIFAAGHMEKHGVKDICVDGGMLCNYPVHCFDGWFLSMDPNDSFFNKVETPYAMMDRSSFMPFNKKTLGFLLYEEKEKEVIRPLLEARDGTPLPLKPKPETRLYRHKTSKRGKKSKRDTETDGKTDSSAGIITVRAVEAFFKVSEDIQLQFMY